MLLSQTTFHQRALEKIATIDETILNSLLSALKKSNVLLNARNIALNVTSQVEGINFEEAIDIIELIVYLYSFVSDESSQSLSDPTEPLVNSENLDLNWLREKCRNYRINQPQQTDLETTFLELANKWHNETRLLSSTDELVMHPSYQQIIGMGKDVVPFLLRELERSSGRWFWALKAIVREDPVPPEQRGKTKEMIQYWLDWGRKKGYIW